MNFGHQHNRKRPGPEPGKVGSVKAAWLFSTPVRQEPSHYRKRVAEDVLDMNQLRLGFLINHAPTVRADGSINRLARVRSYEKLAVAACLLAPRRVLILDDTL